MTRDRDFKNLVRRRMAETGETYAAARANLRPDRGAAPANDPVKLPGDAIDHALLAARTEQDRLVRPYFDGPLLRSIPARRKARAAVLLDLLAGFRPGRTYSETEVNTVLGRAHNDVAFLRRELVNYRYLARDGRGSYWVCRQVPERDSQEAQETSGWEKLWLPRFLAGQTAAPAAETATTPAPATRSTGTPA
ncbi:DUF2087 domain-containing protein [Arthrobacter sp. KK5.5]|uniref:DUF2087 domain-containing protein n=1 Tax=Arthrobacter sp. KK5.5 TaxID=3373084 RepID=UPI003EE5D1FF